MRMVVTAPTATVYGKALVAGDEFDCPESEAKVWEALSRAKAAGEGESGLFGDKAESADTADAGGRRRRSGSYSRRDMRAES